MSAGGRGCELIILVLLEWRVLGLLSLESQMKMAEADY